MSLQKKIKQVSTETAQEAVRESFNQRVSQYEQSQASMVEVTSIKGSDPMSLKVKTPEGSETSAIPSGYRLVSNDSVGVLIDGVLL